MEKKKIFNFHSTKKFDLWVTGLSNKLFLINYRFFDLNSKMNGSLSNVMFFPASFSTAVTLPLILLVGNADTKLRIILNCLKIIWFFTFQTSFLKKWIVTQQIKKKNSGFVLQTKTVKAYSYDRLFYYVLTILPYLRVSYGTERGALVTDGLGGLTFTVDDITFFSHYLDEKHVEWDKKFLFSFQWVDKLRIKSKFSGWFFFLPFIRGMLFWVLWSSIGLKCHWGHSGWMEFSKFSSTVINSNSIFFKKNFKF